MKKAKDLTLFRVAIASLNVRNHSHPRRAAPTPLAGVERRFVTRASPTPLLFGP
jgi:hypothetical protein